MSSFRIHSDDSSFNNRVNALFDSLDAAAANHPLPTVDSALEREPRDNDDFIFARPKIPPVNIRLNRDNRRGRGSQFYGRGPPDYIKHPEKWTRYSMKDTKCLSDRENKELGLKMYNELRSQCAENETVDEDRDRKVVFRNPRRKREELDTEEENPEEYQDTSIASVFGGTKKLVMREYEVGKTKSKVKGKRLKKEAEDHDTGKRKDKVQLDYLSYEDEEED